MVLKKRLFYEKQTKQQRGLENMIADLCFKDELVQLEKGKGEVIGECT